MRKAILVVSLVAALVLVVGVAVVGADSAFNFTTHLNGANEVPVRQTLAQGQAIFHLSDDGEALYYKVIATNIDNVFMAHIHLAPEPGENGGIVAWLYPAESFVVSPTTPPASWIEGRTQGVLAEGALTEDDLVGELEGDSLSDLLAAIESGRAYVNVHTSDFENPGNTGPGDFPGGEIRGDLH